MFHVKRFVLHWTSVTSCFERLPLPRDTSSQAANVRFSIRVQAARSFYFRKYHKIKRWRTLSQRLKS